MILILLNEHAFLSGQTNGLKVHLLKQLLALRMELNMALQRSRIM